MKRRAYYDKATVMNVGRAYTKGIPMSKIAAHYDIPYKTIVYWIKRLKKSGLREPLEEIRGTEKFDFKDIVRTIEQNPFDESPVPLTKD